jgi:hypothetical protein
MDYDYEFINTFNDFYPYDRYIVKEPKQINYLFDDVILTEIFIPATEIKLYIDDEGGYHGHSEVPDDEIYIKLKCKNECDDNWSEFRMAYSDFNEHIREEIRCIILKDFGGYEWQSLYVEYEEEYEYDELKDALKLQKQLITEKYGICNIKEYFNIEHTIEMINNF